MIGISKLSLWLPNNFEDSHYISEQSGIPEQVVREKMGIKKKCRAPKNVMPSEMAVRAAQKIFNEESIDPNSIDLIIWTGSEYKDYPVWSAGIYVQEQLGCHKAFAFDASARCSSNVLGLKIAKSMMLGDQNIRRVLLCGGHKTGDLVNYKDANARFLYNLSDGGSAILIEKEKGNEILDSCFITDGSFSEDVIVQGGGTKNPPRDNPAKELSYLSVPNVVQMRERLGAKSLNNFIKVIKQSAENSFDSPLDYLALLHMKKSIHTEILSQFELNLNQSYYLDEFGHFGAPDQVLSMALAEKETLLKKNANVVLASAGIGYTWSAIGINWKDNVATKDALNFHEIDHI